MTSWPGGPEEPCVWDRAGEAREARRALCVGSRAGEGRCSGFKVKAEVGHRYLLQLPGYLLPGYRLLQWDIVVMKCKMVAVKEVKGILAPQGFAVPHEW